MPGPPPKMTRRRRNVPASGEWKATPGVGWQHGPIPEPPTRMLKASREAWATWMGSWFAAHWDPAVLPALRQLIRLFDLVERGGTPASYRAELRVELDGYGITLKGQQMLHWAPPKAEDRPADEADPYSHLRVVS